MKTRYQSGCLLVVGVLGITLVMSWCLWARPLTYSAKEIRGQVVDAQTGQPLEGVVLVVQWFLFVPGLGHGQHEVMQVAEAVTDHNGTYVIPGWGPKLRIPLTELDYDPRILVFKSGYKHQTLVDQRPSDASLRVSEWDGKTIKLEKFAGDAKTKLDELDTVLGNSATGDNRDGRILTEILKEEQTYPSWPAGAKAFFTHVRELSAKGALK